MIALIWKTLSMQKIVAADYSQNWTLKSFALVSE